MPEAPKPNRGPSAGPGNRRALITAAREIFAGDGYAAPLSSVARRAGVGQGSLYRHFPDRVALAVAVFDENLTELEELAAHPGTTVDALLDGVVAQALVSTAMIEMIRAERDDERVDHLGERMRSVVTEVVSREQAAGRLGAGVTADDVFLVVSMLAGLLSVTPPSQRPAAVTRARELLAPGLSAP
ncbi:TetR/AcrR family transcriptional regulator [Herbiconiux sp. CPCC 205716]|uniref:TetR/AcrR family transcriptional regulator n=1 Tax=Herbiconiux gentiana TaxID=2970912 RepID=A0ABT2GIU4_9MICO|nr:TetR/AcrR family transcriptional regulator [Herbiconiux gentiana]MCS5715517.1 TetR/AcrR family transcriptional regulator [Herbiconiux gentiana]